MDDGSVVPDVTCCLDWTCVAVAVLFGAKLRLVCCRWVPSDGSVEHGGADERDEVSCCSTDLYVRGRGYGTELDRSCGVRARTGVDLDVRWLVEGRGRLRSLRLWM